MIYKFIILDVSGGRQNLQVTIRHADIFVFADVNATGLAVDNATVMVLKQQEGFTEVEEMIRKNKVVLSGYKVIVLLCGRADLWISDKFFEKSVLECILAIREVNKDAYVVLNATLPVVGERRSVIDTANFRAGLLSRLAAKTEKLEFSKPGRRLIRKPGGAIKEYFDPGNMLTGDGLAQVKRGIEAKIHCARLLERSV